VCSSDLTYEGLKIGDLEFLPPELIEFESLVNKDGCPINYPPGIIMNSHIILQTRDNIRNITTPTECFLNQEGLSLLVNPDSYQIKIGDTYALYRTQLNSHRVWTTPNPNFKIKVQSLIMRLK
jgi:hypothetical protein